MKFIKEILIIPFVLFGANYAIADNIFRYESVIKQDSDGSFFAKDEDISSMRTTYYYDPDKWDMGKCEKDRFNGNKSCEVRSGRLAVIILNGSKFVSITGADFPKKQSALKVDQNNTIFGVEGRFKNNSIIIKQLSEGKTAYIRYVEWPYLAPKDVEIDLTGFKEAYQNMLKEFSKLK